MRSIRAIVVCALFLACAPMPPAWAEPALTLQTGPGSGPPLQPGPAGYEPRFAPSGYQFDDGTFEVPLGPGGAADYVFATRFEAVGGADLLTSISFLWESTGIGAGQTATIHVWIGDGADRRLIYSQVVTLPSPAPRDFTAYPVAVPVSGPFYVGFSRTSTGLERSMAVDRTEPIVFGRSFVAILASGTLDPATVTLSPMESLGPRGYFGIRATGSNAGFTYQGRLESEGAPYSGQGDVRFRIMDAQTGGTALGPAFLVQGVAFDDGLFSARVPADASLFDPGPDRWLEIAVRTPGGAGEFTTLSPRQRITSAPTALAAQTAVRAATATTANTAPWSGLTGVPANVSDAFSPWVVGTGGIAYTGGRVGIGTTDPAAALHVRPAAGINIGVNPFNGGSTNLRLDLTAVNGGRGRIQAISAAGSGFGTLLLNPSGGRVSIGADPASVFHELEVSTSSALALGLNGSSTIGTWLNINNTSAGGRFWRLISTGSGNGEGAGKLLLSHGTVPGTTDGITPITLTTSAVGVFTNNPIAGFVLDVRGALRCVGFTNASSARYKRDIRDHAGDVMGRFNQLRPVTFTWNDSIPSVAGRHDLGLIAEDVAALFPEVVSIVDGKADGIDFTKLTTLSIQAIREQDRTIQKQGGRIEQLAAENRDLRERLERLEKALHK